MSNKVTPDSFRASMDRCLSGTKADPFLASRIIASEKEEPKMKKASLRIVLVLIVLIILATVAYAATQIRYLVDWKGNMIEESPETDIWDENFKSQSGISSDEALKITREMIHDVPDEDDVSVWYTTRDFGIGSRHPKQKHFTSFEEFKQYMADCDYLTIPIWIPEDAVDFHAEVHMDMSPSIFKKALDVEEWTDGPICYRRFTYDDSFAVKTLYRMTFKVKSNESVIITSDLCANLDIPGYDLSESDIARVVSVKGMSDALIMSDSERNNKVLCMHHQLKESIRYQYIEGDGESIVSSGEEYILVHSSVLDDDFLLRLFNGE